MSEEIAFMDLAVFGNEYVVLRADTRALVSGRQLHAMHLKPGDDVPVGAYVYRYNEAQSADYAAKDVYVYERVDQ